MFDNKTKLLSAVHAFFSNRGYRFRIGFGINKIAIAAGTSDITPYFAPSIVNKNGGWQVLGSVGYFSEEFENYWTKMLEYKNLLKNDTLLLSLYMTNLPDFINIKQFHNSEEILNNWLLEIDSHLKDMPMMTIDDIYNIFSGKGEHYNTYMHWIGHPVKIRTFNIWFNREKLRQNRRKLSEFSIQQIEPYGEIVSLLLTENNLTGPA
jgi:hypothetical protein